MYFLYIVQICVEWIAHYYYTVGGMLIVGVRVIISK